MAKKSAVEKNNRRKRIVARKGARRQALRATIRDRSLPMWLRPETENVAHCGP